jgi:hypothetical protein
LRDRGLDDLKALFFSFWKKLGDARVVNDGVFEALRSYPWPGNVRELENFVERLSVVSRGTVIQASDVPDSYRQPLPPRRAPTMLPMTVLPVPSLPEPEPEPVPAYTELSWLDALPGSVTSSESAAVVVAAPPPPPSLPSLPSPSLSPPPPPPPSLPSPAMAPLVGGGELAVRLPVDLSAHLDVIERSYIEAALRATGGNKQASADLLGLQRTTLVAKCKKHGLEDAGKSADDVAGSAGLRVELAEEQRPLLSLRGGSFRVAVIREEVIELVPVDVTSSTTTDTAPVAGSCVVDGETLRLFGALRPRGDGVVLLDLAIPLERVQLVNLQRALVKRRPRTSKSTASVAVS